MTSYKDLLVWQKAMDLVVTIYQLTKGFPDEERFGLTSQMRRAAVSIPSNIAEGRKRTSRTEFRRFMVIAYGSSSELETQLEICKRLGIINQDIYKGVNDDLVVILKMLNKLISALA